jgi:hypothetical protein
MAGLFALSDKCNVIQQMAILMVLTERKKVIDLEVQAKNLSRWTCLIVILPTS